MREQRGFILSGIQAVGQIAGSRVYCIFFWYRNDAVFRRLRIALLLLILLIVVLGNWVTRSISTDWQRTLWVNVHPINGDSSPAVERYIDSLSENEFADVVDFFRRETERYGQPSAEVIRLYLANNVDELPPQPPFEGNVIQRISWSLKMRWWSYQETKNDPAPTPDIRLFLVLHEARKQRTLGHSYGLQKGMLAFVNAFADRRYRGNNNVIIAHEILHTLGASDKYDLSNGLPFVPEGLANPDQRPLYPQTETEIMGGRRLLRPGIAQMPDSLTSVRIGPITADEIRLQERAE